MKVFARCTTIHDEYAGKIPYNRNIAIAIEGFHEMGFEIHFYDRVDEIYDLYELGDIVLDGIAQVEYCLQKFGLSFPSINYPDVLKPYLGRKIWTDKMNHIAQNSELWGNFVKPIKEKQFTGHIIQSSKDLIGCGSCYEDFDVLVSEPLDIVYEVRGLVYYDEMVDLRPYHGDWQSMNKLDTRKIQKAMEDWKTWKDRPMGCTLDWGVIRVVNNSGHESFFTVLIEANDGLCFGPYSTNAIQYAKIISAAMSSICGTKDECYFG